MRYLILSDIHANVDALEAVLDAAAAETWDQVLVLGDLVGYGAEPNGVIERVLSLSPLATIRGNHDKAACWIEHAVDFNHVARAAAIWTNEQLTPEHRTYLERLPSGPMSIDDRVEICHGAPFDEDHYIFGLDDAADAMDAAARPLCLFGHTHLPVIYRRADDGDVPVVPDGEAKMRINLLSSARYLINPGSVGQPRDGDPRAGYAIHDADKREITLFRVEYSIESAQRRIVDAGLPLSLAQRLSIGR